MASGCPCAWPGRKGELGESRGANGTQLLGFLAWSIHSTTQALEITTEKTEAQAVSPGRVALAAFKRDSRKAEVLCLSVCSPQVFFYTDVNKWLYLLNTESHDIQSYQKKNSSVQKFSQNFSS